MEALFPVILGFGFVVALVVAALKSGVAPMQPSPPRERPKKILAWGDQVLLAAAQMHGLRHSLDVAQGRVDGLRVTLEAKPHAAAERRELRFLGGAVFPRPLGLELSVERAGALSLGGDFVPISDAFDMEFRASALHEDQAQKLLSGELGEALLYAERKGWEPRLDDEGLRVQVQGALSTETIQEGFDWLIQTARLVLETRAKLPLPELEQRVLDAFRSLAEARGGNVDQASRELVMESEHGEVRASLEHTKGKVWRTRLVVQLSRPLPADLHLGLESERSALERWRRPDVQLGDQAFDAAFVVKGESDEAVRAVLTETARERLLALKGQVQVLELEPTGLLVAKDEALDSPEPLASMLDAALGALDVLNPTATRSAYR